MSDADIEPRVLAAFLAVAPDVDPATLDRATPFRDQFDFDSMDTLNFAIGLHDAFGIDVPQTDYRSIGSLAGAVSYIRSALHSDDLPS